MDKSVSVDFIASRGAQLPDGLQDQVEINISPTLTGGFHIVYTRVEDMPLLNNYVGRTFVASHAEVLGLVDLGCLEFTGYTQSYNQTPLAGKGIILGFVDTGIEYTNSIFRRRDGRSRILGIYDQTVAGSGPYGFGIGTEFNQTMINEALQSPNPYATVPSFDDAAHGTFLASVAAGGKQQNFAGVAPEADLLVVKLRKAHPYYLKKYLVPQSQENAFSSTDVILGVEYIVRRAMELGRPVAICLGLGSNYGGHDGNTLLEQYLGEVSKIKGVCICVAGGNESLARRHYFGQIPAEGGVQEVVLEVGEGQSDIYMTMWNNAPDQLRVSLVSPSGSVVEGVALRPGTQHYRNLLNDHCHVQVEYHYPVFGSGCQNTVIRILTPCGGLWRIRIHGDKIYHGGFHIWLPIVGFVSPAVSFTSPDRNYTITIPGTSQSLITCGAYNTFEDLLCVTSSWGPSRTNKMLPDLAAPGVDITGIFPGGFGRMTGTGAAAAILAGSCAILMEKGLSQKYGPLNTEQIRALLIRHATRPPGVDYPNYLWGYGLLNLEATLAGM